MTFDDDQLEAIAHEVAKRMQDGDESDDDEIPSLDERDLGEFIASLYGEDTGTVLDALNDFGEPEYDEREMVGLIASIYSARTGQVLEKLALIEQRAESEVMEEESESDTEEQEMAEAAIHEPEWDDTADQEWNSPDLEDFTDTSWEELSEDERSSISDHFVVSDTGSFPPENFSDLALPVVEPDGTLNLNALSNAKARAGQVSSLDDDQVEEVKSMLTRMANENFEDADFTEVENDEDNKGFAFADEQEVTWESSGGRAFGLVRDMTATGCYDAAIDGEVKVCGNPENPAYLIEVYDDDQDELTGTMVAHEEDALDAADIDLSKHKDDMKVQKNEEIDTTPPDNVADEAQKALDARDNEEFDNDECGTDVGWERANQLTNQESLSRDTIERMVSFFARHEGNEEVEGDVKEEDCGWLMFKAWGGEAGREWAEGVLDNFEDDEQENDDEPDENEAETIFHGKQEKNLEDEDEDVIKQEIDPVASQRVKKK